MSEGTTRQKLLDEFDAVVSETEQLLKSISGSVASGEMTSTMRAKLEQNLRDAKERLVDLEKTIIKHGRDAARAADDYVHENPWRSVGIAAGVGFLLGILLSRR
ncbi:MAG TPA: DUF883 family protein [bacterium]